jgi:hypothetical protein
MTPTAIPDEAARSRTLHFLTHPKLWPNWPFLPVVRRRPGQEELGVVFDALGACDLPGYSTTVFVTNLFLMPRSLDQFLALPHETFDVPEEVCAAGWNVD